MSRSAVSVRVFEAVSEPDASRFSKPLADRMMESARTGAETVTDWASMRSVPAWLTGVAMVTAWPCTTAAVRVLPSVVLRTTVSSGSEPLSRTA